MLNNRDSIWALLLNCRRARLILSIRDTEGERERKRERGREKEREGERKREK